MNGLYEYKMINLSLEPTVSTIEAAANRWAEMGWRTIAVMPSRGPGYADTLLIERRKDPDDAERHG